MLSGGLVSSDRPHDAYIPVYAAVTPGPMDSVYSVLLDGLLAPRLRVYPTYTVVAEKLHVIALLGMTTAA